MGCSWSKQLFRTADQRTDSNQDVNTDSEVHEEGLHSVYGDSVRLELIKNDILNLKNTNSIVNFVYQDDIYGRLGIIQAAGDAVKQQYDTNRQIPDREVHEEGLHSVYGDSVRLELIKNDILNLKNTNSIVNFVYQDDIYGRLGIIQAAGDAVKQQYDTNRQIPDLPHVRYGVVMTTAGNLPYQAIFHVTVFEQSAKFEMAIYKALQLGDRKGMRSIALPALSSKTMADSCLKVLYEFEKRADPMCLHLIDIITSNDSDNDYYEKETGKRGEYLNIPEYSQVEINVW